MEDLKNLGTIPCVRNSLLYGIGTGVGIGAVRFLGTRSELPRVLWEAHNSRVDGLELGGVYLLRCFSWKLVSPTAQLPKEGHRKLIRPGRSARSSAGKSWPRSA